MFVDNDRFQFCSRRVTTLFYWCVCDLYGLVSFVQTHCRKCGAASDSGEVGSTREASGPKKGRDRDAMFKAVVAKQRTMIKDLQQHRRISDAKLQVTLLTSKIRATEAALVAR